MKFDLGFLGGGQLARMSIQAAQRMGLTCLSLDPGETTPASRIAASVQGELNDPDAVAEVFRRCERVTLENEFIPAESIEQAIRIAGADPRRLIPGTAELATIQDKLLQRLALSKAGVPGPKAVALEGDGQAARQIGFPLVLKARFGGYDGRGTRYARDEAEFAALAPEWGGGGWLAEQFVPFVREVAVMVYRAAGHRGCFATMETVQANHVCDLVFPTGGDASEVALAAVEAIDGQGLFGVELFELESGEFLVNEMAPRPHNSGHYTLDWGGVSQFEQHVRLAMGFEPSLPLGGPVAMANLLGVEHPGDFRDGLRAALEFEPGCHVHWYGKVEARRGRKMGHLNVPGQDCAARAVAARAAFLRAWSIGEG